jgi:uncharacterized membrane protein
LAKRPPLLHYVYLGAILIKGLDGGLEAVAGLILSLTGPQRFYHWLIRITAPELTGNHPAIHAIRNGAERLGQGSHEFVIFYLLVHGFLKLGVVIALLKGGGRWVFPAAALILAGFVAYMSWRLSIRWSGWLLSFALFDFFTLALVLNEWRSVRAGTVSRRASAN